MSHAENTQPKSNFDPAKFKEQERAGFNLVANHYEEATEAIRKPVVTRMLELADLQPGLSLLDVATGPGSLAREAARKLGSGQVLGVDIAEDALEVARQRAASEGLDFVSFQVEDAENLSLPDNSFDRALCSLGLMHFPHPEKALAEIRRVLKPGGRLVASVWGEAQEAPLIQVALQTLARNFPPPKVERPSMFRFGQPAILEQLVSEAGFAQVKTEKVLVKAESDSPAVYWRRFLNTAGITAVALSKQPPEVQTHLEKDVEKDLAPYRRGDRYDLTSAIMLVTGVKE
jgi:ubiquinone/menaquinone biosynthesis C-methylase UbiE